MTTQPIALFVTFHALPGKFDELLAVLTDMTIKTRAETGCFQYDLHLNANEPNQLHFYEQWASTADHAAHDLTEHVQHFREIQADLVERIEFVKLNVLA